MMRVKIATRDRGEIPVNTYAINLAACVDEDTEYLTPTGWKRIADYRTGDRVLEIDPYNNVRACFKTPISYIKQPATEDAYVVSPNSRSKLSMMVSPNHTVLFEQTSGSRIKSYKTKTAADFFKMRTDGLGIPSNFNINSSTSLTMTPDEIAIQVAFAADGSLKPKYKCGARIRVKKQRKVDRLYKLLNLASIPYKKTIEKDYTVFWFTPPLLEKSLNWAWPANAAQLKIIAEESVHWDGCIDKRTGNHIFFTTIKNDADFMQYAYQATFSTVISLISHDRRGRKHIINGKDYATKSIDYTVRQTTARVKNVMFKNVNRKPMPNGIQYCFTTSTGYWLMRKDNHISITGNSGNGKGYSTNIIEDNVINNFRTTFFDITYPVIVEENLAKLALKRAYIKGVDPDAEEIRVKTEFHDLGALAFSFDSGTTAAIKQMRHKLLMSQIGSMNLEIDEIGSNLLGNLDALGTFLELYDVGKIKQKLIKNTKENLRNEEIEGRTPTNLLLFGTPSKLLDGNKTEDEFYSFLETGYARRSLFGFSRTLIKDKTLTAEQVYDAMTDVSVDAYLEDLSIELGALADITNYNKLITMSKDVTLLQIEYRLHCEALADDLKEHEEIQRAELSHRYFKALKLAGTYAFIDGQSDVSESNMYAAIHMVEESGKAFNQILKRQRNYEKLARYIADTGREVTHVDLTQDLPFYKGSISQKNDLMQLAIAWGYKNQVIIKKSIVNNIEFITGETLKKTDLNEMILSHSNDIAVAYKNEIAPWDKLHILTQMSGKHWTNHHVTDYHRCEDCVIPGFNMIVLDIDDGDTTVASMQTLLKEYTYMYYTTKRHFEGDALNKPKHRFRLLMPLDYHLALDREDHKEFIHNIYNWLPFDVDTNTSDRSRKWLSNNGDHGYNTGKFIDVMPFIPKTTKNDERKKVVQDLQSLNNLERWFVQNATNGSRNNQLIKYALVLVDMGYDLDNTQNGVLSLNQKLDNSLPEDEIRNTIFSTVAKAIIEKGK